MRSRRSTGTLNSNIGADLIVVQSSYSCRGGCLIVSKHPGNLVGVGMCLILPRRRFEPRSTHTLPNWLLTEPEALPARRLMTWRCGINMGPGAVLPGLTLLFLLFPDGSWCRPAWRRVAILDIAITSFVIAGPSHLDQARLLWTPLELVNPLVSVAMRGVLDVANEISLVLRPLPSLRSGAAIDSDRHVRRSTGTERQQYKWLAARRRYWPATSLAQASITRVLSASHPWLRGRT